MSVPQRCFGKKLTWYAMRWDIGESREGHMVQSVRDRPRLKDSRLVAGEAPWRESKGAELSDDSEKSVGKALGCNVQ